MPSFRQKRSAILPRSCYNPPHFAGELLVQKVIVPNAVPDSQFATPFRYDRETILLHWCTAVLVVALWGIAQIIDFFPNGPLRVDVRSLHIALGATLAILLARRVIRRVTGRAAAAPQPSGILERAASLGHIALYALAILAVLTGIANAWTRGDSIFNLFAIPSFAPDDRALHKLVGTLHAYATNTLLIVAAGHAAFALFHYYVLRDDILRRMLPTPGKAALVDTNRDST
jgi:cytochrome b561